MVQNLMAKSIPGARREGHAVPMNFLSNKSGGVAEYGLDLSDAPVPSRRYAADLCAIRTSYGEMRVVFAQFGFDEQDIESALVIRMSRTAVRQFAESLISIMPGAAETPEEALSEIEKKPSQTASMVANICSVAVAGQEACLDFYHASAFAMRKVELGSSAMELESVVRVDMRSPLFMAFAHRTIEIAKQIKMEDSDERIS